MGHSKRTSAISGGGGSTDHTAAGGGNWQDLQVVTVDEALIDFVVGSQVHEECLVAFPAEQDA